MLRMMLLLVAIHLSGYLMSQTNPSQDDQVSRTDFALSVGVQFFDHQVLTLQGISEAYPNSTLLPKNFDDYENQSFLGSESTSPLVNMFFGIPINTKGETEHRIRFGLTYNYHESGFGGYFSESRTPYDTLVSSNTGDLYFVDSVSTEGINLRQTQELLSLDMAYLVRANPQGRLSFYFGIGLGAGFIFDPIVEVDVFRNSYISGPYNPNNAFPPIGENAFEYERMEGEGGFIAYVYLPLGIDMRLAKFQPFWSRMHIFSEFKPSIYHFNYENRASHTQSSFGLALLGLRHEF